MATQRLMKDGLDQDAVSRLGKSLARTVKGFPVKRFEKDAMAALPGLELKQRVLHLVSVLHQYLPDDFRKTAPLLTALKENWDEGDPDDSLRSFAAWPVIDYVGEHGIAHPRQALATLKNLTSLFSAEFAIRPFITHHFDTTWKHLEQWCNNRDEHVRRLVSEGTRPRLPWGAQLAELIRDPKPVLPLLEKLKDDKSEYVRRSVANNLNDISKDHPELVIRTGKRWLKQATSERQWIIRHATRTLVKKGHADVFPLLGYSSKPVLEKTGVRTTGKIVHIGNELEFTVSLTASAKAKHEQRMVIDYAIYFMKANGRQNPKVFKLKNVLLNPGEKLVINKRHSFRLISTRRYYPGQHKLVLLINGREMAEAGFRLTG